MRRRRGRRRGGARDFEGGPRVAGRGRRSVGRARRRRRRGARGTRVRRRRVRPACDAGRREGGRPREWPRGAARRDAAGEIAPTLGGGVPGQGEDGDGAAGAGQGGDLRVHRGDTRVDARERRALGLDARGDAAQHALARRLERLERREHLLVRLALRQVRGDRRHGELMLHDERATRERRGTPAPPPPRARDSARAGGCCAG